VPRRLEEVKLTSAADLITRAYSGGMRRRLSVAVALIGNPDIVYLDEPTTGMDPISRRYVWDIILAAKKGRAVVLTTHSMEEADILGDRIAIMAKGRLRCIGTSIRLKSRFGAGYRVSVSVMMDGSAMNQVLADRVKSYFKDVLGVAPSEESQSYIHFTVPRSFDDRLGTFFAELRQNSQAFGITDIQVGLCTLEDVFLNIARKAELEAAQAAGKKQKITLEDGLEVEVPLGADFVDLPGTATNPSGERIFLRWGQDESGNLQFSGSSRVA
jgi:ABC-type multidrug transport system ATPase subunit